jgi:hypothetical protein
LGIPRSLLPYIYETIKPDYKYFLNNYKLSNIV